MKKLLRIYEDDAIFPEIMEKCVIDNNIENWERYDTQYGYEHARPLISKETNRHVGWFVFEQFYDSSTCEMCEETYATIEGNVIDDW